VRLTKGGIGDNGGPCASANEYGNSICYKSYIPGIMYTLLTLPVIAASSSVSLWLFFRLACSSKSALLGTSVAFDSLLDLLDLPDRARLFCLFCTNHF
jgi:hypothetical protein